MHKYYIKAIIILIPLFFTNPLAAQKVNKLDINSVDSISTTDMYRMMTLLGLDIRKYSISSDFKEFYCNLIVEEYDKGKLVNTFNGRKTIGPLNAWIIKIGNNLQNNRFPISFYTQNYQDTVVKANIHVGELEYNRKILKHPKLVYTWKEIYNISNNTHLLPNIKYPLIAYTSAVDSAHTKTKGASEFCLLNGDLIKVENWFSELGVQHVTIFYLNLEK